MTDQELDALLRDALLDSMKADMEAPAAEWKETDAPAFTPSRRHEREMQNMLKDPNAWARRRSRPVWKTALRRAAMFLLILFLSAGVLLAVSPAARAMITRWFVTWDEGHILRYRYVGPSLAQVAPSCTITALPEGFEETQRKELYTAAFITYENADGDALYLEYGQIVEGAQVRRKADGYRNDTFCLVAVRVGDTDAQFIPSREPGGVNTLAWYDRENSIQFALAGAWEQDDMIHMAESISLVKMTE